MCGLFRRDREDSGGDAPLDLSGRTSPKLPPSMTSRAPLDPRDLAAAASALQAPLAAAYYPGTEQKQILNPTTKESTHQACTCISAVGIFFCSRV